ncbi:MAG TPA: sigma-70 family RNA polymerase sigma factor [Pirellulales bacterium]|jgi:RNA polymerase sigma-70 factor (ECF subfamily)
MTAPVRADDQADSNKQLMLLMVRHQRQILSYIYSLVPNRHDAEDLLQETSLVVCEKFAEYKPNTNFLAWACQIAFWRVRAARQKFARSKLIFDDEVLQAVGRTALSEFGELNARHAALERCLKKLDARARALVMARYEPGGTVDSAAQRTHRTVEAAYKALSRIRKLLMDCVTKHLSAEGAA